MQLKAPRFDFVPCLRDALNRRFRTSVCPISVDLPSLALQASQQARAFRVRACASTHCNHRTLRARAMTHPTIVSSWATSQPAAAQHALPRRRSNKEDENWLRPSQVPGTSRFPANCSTHFFHQAAPASSWWRRGGCSSLGAAWRNLGPLELLGSRQAAGSLADDDS